MSMFLKTMMFHIFIGSVFMGVVVTALLVVDQASLMSILAGALIAFVLAGPISWAIAKRLH
ncbi:MAG: hypothetical protein Pars2KO_12730 [Parasphingorhabdus sp.]